jgi:hypothetical protein
MPQILLKSNNKISLASIDSTNDLELREGLININPPPSDGRCECCGKHLSELRPFGKAGDPYSRDCDGALLVKRWRSFGRPDKEVETIDDNYVSCIRAVPSYDKTGQVIAAHLIIADPELGAILASWECRDCIVLSTEEYYQKKYASAYKPECRLVH